MYAAGVHVGRNKGLADARIVREVDCYKLVDRHDHGLWGGRSRKGLAALGCCTLHLIGARASHNYFVISLTVGDLMYWWKPIE